MKLITNTKGLKEALEWTGKAVPARPNHPILANILINGLSLTGFDLSIGINAKIEGEIEEEGSITLPSKLFSEIIKKLPNGQITIETDEEAIATITSDSGKYQIRGLSAGEYPGLPAVEGEPILIPAQAILDGAKCLEFASTEETKQVLCGIHLKIGTEDFEFAATDGHRLAVVTVPDEPEGIETGDFEITIPARAFREVERMVENYKSEENQFVTLYCDKVQAVFELAGQRVICRALEGAYPAYPQLLPKQFSNIVTLDRRSFLGALERTAVLAAQGKETVVCEVDHLNQQISLSADVADVGNAKESLPAQISAEDPKELAFNVKYLIAGLKQIDTTEVSLHLNQATSPVIVTPLGGIKMVFLLMPVQLRK